MKRFSFRLHRLEKLRKSERREARSALAAALAVVERRREAREAMERAIEDADRAKLPEETASVPSALRAMAAWREALRQALLRAAEEELAAQEAALEAEHRYTEAARAHRVLEKMRKRRRDRWLDEANREEQKFLDEVHLLRVAREHAAEEVSR